MNGFYGIAFVRVQLGIGEKLERNRVWDERENATKQKTPNTTPIPIEFELANFIIIVFEIRFDAKEIPGHAHTQSRASKWI